MHEMADPVPLSLGGHTIVGDRPGNEDAYMFKKDINEEGQKTDGVRRAFAAVFGGNFLYRNSNVFIDIFGINGRIIVVIIAQFGTFGCGTNMRGCNSEVTIILW